MKYLGGKCKISKYLTKFLNQQIEKNNISNYWEPFCGSCWTMSQINCKNRIASDLHYELISMWIALQKGWIPPSNVSEEMYYLVKSGDDAALKGFVGFGCSFGGKYWGGYARRRDGERNYASESVNSLNKKMKNLIDVEFICGSYDTISHPSKILIYCDPPYEGVTKYSTGDFDHKKFWDWVRLKSVDNTVFVSEYAAPDDFECVWQYETKTDMRNSLNQKEKRVEKLFRLKGEL